MVEYVGDCSFCSFGHSTKRPGIVRNNSGYSCSLGNESCIMPGIYALTARESCDEFVLLPQTVRFGTDFVDVEAVPGSVKFFF